MAALALLGLGGLARADTGGQPGKPPEASSSPDRPVSWTVAPDDVQAAEAYLREHFADRFGGLYLDEGAGGRMAVVVVLTRPLDPAAEQALRDRLGGRSLRFAEGTYTLAELESVHQRLTQEIGRLQDQGVQVVWTGVDVRTNRVILGVSSSLEAARAAVRQLPGAGAVEVVAAEPVRPLGAEGGPAVTAAPSPVTDATDAHVGREPASRTDAPPRATGWWAALLATLRSWWMALAGLFR
ncbi:MAG TPA: alpha-lytic protease prodomain-containing protein [Thermaerobacter sp.]